MDLSFRVVSETRVNADDLDIQLTESDRLAFLDACASVATDERMARRVLAAIDFPAGRIPHLGATTPELAWYSVFEELRRGAVHAPYRRLLEAVSKQWPNNPEFARLRRAYRPEPTRGVEGAGPDAEDDASRPRRRALPFVVGAVLVLAAAGVSAFAATAVFDGGGEVGTASGPRLPAPSSPGPASTAGGTGTGTPSPTPGGSHGPTGGGGEGGAEPGPGLPLPSPGSASTAGGTGTGTPSPTAVGRCRPTGGGVTEPPFFPPGGDDSADVRVTGVALVLAENANTLTAGLSIAVDGTVPPGYRLHLFSREDKLSRGRGPGTDGYVPGDDTYKAAAAIRPDSAGCWQGTIRLGDAEEVGLDFDLFVVLLDGQAYTRYVADPPPGERLFTRASFSEGTVLWLTQIEVPT